MLKKIIALENFGLFSSGVSTPAVFGRVTLLYGENGRGKSTLAALLRACALGDATHVISRKTLDTNSPQKIDLLFEFAGKNTSVAFANGAWSGATSQIEVFDAEFVEQNVYSGQEVRAEQKRALLEFALGDQAVSLRKRINDLTMAISDESSKRSEAEKNIAAFAQRMPIAKFIDLAFDPDATHKIDALRRRIDAARNASILSARHVPTMLTPPAFDVEAFYAVLMKTLDGLEQDAEAVVRLHFSRHSTPHGIEAWISTGQSFTESDRHCPFCGQGLQGLALIDAYKGYFNEAYKALKHQISGLIQMTRVGLSGDRISALAAQAETNSARIEAWKDQLDIEIPMLDTDDLMSVMAAARNLASELASAKQLKPLELYGAGGEKAIIIEALDKIETAITNYNLAVTSAIGKIKDFQNQLAKENVTELEEKILVHQQVIARQHIDCIKAINIYQMADGEHKGKNKLKTQTRSQLDELMAATLAEYQERINAHLGIFGADFSIEKMKPNYIGTGDPRTEYALRLRGSAYSIGNRNDMSPHFGSMLSDGDKRTLALAFFLAQVTADPVALQGKVLVIDDPVCSLDSNRRAQTVALLTRLAGKCAQIIILSHDAYFLRDLHKSLAKKERTLAQATMSINRVGNDYSAFDVCDIDALCASGYYRNHWLLSEYAAGRYTQGLREVAFALRLFLEGYCHRRFPGLLPKECTFGQVIEEVERAAPGTALSGLHARVDELRQLNDYAGRFHHDTNPGNADTAPVTDGELKNYVKRALELVYKG